MVIPYRDLIGHPYGNLTAQSVGKVELSRVSGITATSIYVLPLPLTRQCNHVDRIALILSCVLHTTEARANNVILIPSEHVGKESKPFECPSTNIHLTGSNT